MAAKKQMRLLVTVDGSERSLNTVRYLSHVAELRRMRVVLFHVFSAAPESFYDLERSAQGFAAAQGARAWEASQRENIQRFMDKAQHLLRRAGFPDEAVSVKVQARKLGIARDIIEEARTGEYHAVVMRRRGLTAMRGIIIGSVATKLLERLDFVPILLVGREGAGPRVLVALDGSSDALKAVDFLAAALARGDYEIELFSVIRAFSGANAEALATLADQETDLASSQLLKFAEKARRRLQQQGFSPERIRTQIITAASSRAGAIVAAARDGGFATIVMGRRGLSHPQDFFMGRVSNKVIQLAREKTVWIVA